MRTVSLIILFTLLGGSSLAEAKPATVPTTQPAPPPATFNLQDFGAVGDGTTDDGPALQSALNAIAAAGGGTLFVPAGRYAIVTPVTKNFTGLATEVRISGVESSTPVPPPTAPGSELSKGLDLVSEFAPKTGAQNAITLKGLDTLLVNDLVFIGTPNVNNDALITLLLEDIKQATIRHCEFYGLSSLNAGGAIVHANRCHLNIEQTKVLGSATSSGVYSSIIQNVEWFGINVSETIFIDYGQRPELFGKMNTAPFSWVGIGNAAKVTATSPRREVVFRSVFADEGAYIGFTSLPSRYPPAASPTDLVYITGLFMNVSNMNTSGHYFDGLENVLIRDSHYGWSHITQGAMNLVGVKNAILDQIECVDEADTILAGPGTTRLTVINSQYGQINSQAQVSNAFTTATADEDPVQHVRAGFLNSLGREPDPAAHFFWSNRILECGTTSSCVTAKRQEFANYLASSPQEKFGVSGRVVNQGGAGMANVLVTLSGSQNVTTTTDADGDYQFTNLPTSGSYTVTPTLKHYSFTAPNKVIFAPAGDQVFNTTASFNHHDITGRITDSAGNNLSGVVLTLSGSQSATFTTGTNGQYSFLDLPAGGNYTVTPRKTSYVFSPVNGTWTDLGADQTRNFTGTFVTYTIAGTVRGPNNNPINGVTLTLSGHQNRTTTSNSNGDFSFTQLPSEQNYTVTPKLLGHIFTPSSKTYTSLVGDQYQVFLLAPKDYRVSGRVTDESGAAVPGATLTATGDANKTATTDANGNYYLDLPAAGNFTIQGSKTNYTFITPPISFSNLSANQTANFTAARNTFNVSGKVVNTNGTGLGGIAVTLSGAQTASTVTSANGDFSFQNLPRNLNYTVTPSLEFHSFSPSSKSYTNLNADRFDQFVCSLNRHTISGRVLGSANAPLAGATVSLSGSLGPISTVTTGADGAFSFAALPAGAPYSLSAQKTNYSFKPSTHNINALAADQTVDFLGAPSGLQYRVSGRVTDESGAAVPGATLTVTGDANKTATTDANGNYFVDLPAAGNFTIQGSKTNYTFNTSPISFSNLSSNQTANFSAARNTFNISGKVVSTNGSAIGGIAVTLSGAQAASTVTAANGDFSFLNLPRNLNYTVTPSLAFHSFSPSSKTYTNLTADQFDHFACSLNSHTISGRVLVGNAPLAGATVSLSGSLGPISTVITGADGAFAFAALPAGASYSLSAQKANYSFSPSTHNINTLAADQTVDFMGEQPILQFSAANYNVVEGGIDTTITVTRSGNLAVPVEVHYSATIGSAQRQDLLPVIGTLTFASGEASQTIQLFITDDSFVEGIETISITLTDPSTGIIGSVGTATVSINDNDSAPSNTNPIDAAQFFVRQHYRDFLHREPDAAGLAFWSEQITSCGTNQDCIASRRVHVSAAFFLSIEFQETGFLVHRLYKAAYGVMPDHINEFLLGSSEIGKGVVVNAPGWQQLLEANKVHFIEGFVSDDRFTEKFPTTMSPTVFVNSLNTSAGNVLTPAETTAAVQEFNGAGNSSDVAARGRVMRRVADSSTLRQRETNPAFVLMQYFGYMQRNPNEAPDSDLTGFNFWLDKLNLFNGDPFAAEMVNSFLVSTEYRSRFGTP